MKPLLKNLMGNGSRDQETLEAVRTALAEIQKERERYEALVEGAKAGADRLKNLSEPLTKTETDVQGLQARITQMEERFAGLVKLSELFQTWTSVRKGSRRARSGPSRGSAPHSRARRSSKPPSASS